MEKKKSEQIKKARGITNPAKPSKPKQRRRMKDFSELNTHNITELTA